MTKWEYLIFARAAGSWTDDRYDSRSPQQRLTDCGAEGWELVSVCYDSSAYNFYFKRPFAARKKAAEKSKAGTRPVKKKT